MLHATKSCLMNYHLTLNLSLTFNLFTTEITDADMSCFVFVRVMSIVPTSYVAFVYGKKSTLKFAN